jgi:hypothetical protein
LTQIQREERGGNNIKRQTSKISNVDTDYFGHWHGCIQECLSSLHNTTNLPLCFFCLVLPQQCAPHRLITNTLCLPTLSFLHILGRRNLLI